MPMRRITGHSGFTLIELIAVIAILAILAVTALPQFFDMRNDARSAAAQGVAGAIASGAAINYARRVTTTAFTTISTCGSIGQLLVGGLPAGVAIETAATAAADGAAADCTIQYSASGGSTTAVARVIMAH
jgi:MSHA pilin protein MshA